jgi:hypothetical protein
MLLFTVGLEKKRVTYATHSIDHDRICFRHFLGGLFQRAGDSAREH